MQHAAATEAWHQGRVKVRLVAVAYALVATLAGGLAVVFCEGRVFSHPAPWLVLDASTSLVASVVLGLAFTAVVVATTRVFVSRFGWADRLASDLRPFAKGLGQGDVVVLAALSSLGEELLFRSLLLPLIGLVLSSLLFGVVHQVRGPARWAGPARRSCCPARGGQRRPGLRGRCC